MVRIGSQHPLSRRETKAKRVPEDRITRKSKEVQIGLRFYGQYWGKSSAGRGPADRVSGPVCGGDFRYVQAALCHATLPRPSF